jgi:hypothetical protein
MSDKLAFRFKPVETMRLALAIVASWAILDFVADRFVGGFFGSFDHALWRYIAYAIGG